MSLSLRVFFFKSKNVLINKIAPDNDHFSLKPVTVLLAEKNWPYLVGHNGGLNITFVVIVATSLDSVSSAVSSSPQSTLYPNQAGEKQIDYNGLDFRLIVDSKSGPQITISLVASTHIEKAAWCSDISQVTLILNFLFAQITNITWQCFAYEYSKGQGDSRLDIHIDDL